MHSREFFMANENSNIYLFTSVTFLCCNYAFFFAPCSAFILEMHTRHSSRGEIMHSLPTVAKRASSTWFHTFEDGESLQLRTGNGYRAGDEDLRFTFSYIMQSVRSEHRDNPSAFQMYSRTENGSRNFSSPSLAPLNVILSYFHLFYSLCLILFLRSPFHIILPKKSAWRYQLSRFSRLMRLEADCILRPDSLTHTFFTLTAWPRRHWQHYAGHSCKTL